jgi:hypothetical protein
MNVDGLCIVAEDLEFLGSWDQDIVGPNIRRGSATLRRLLHEDAYGSAWRAVGRKGQPTLIAVSLDEIANGQDRDKIELALAWGVLFRGVYTTAMIQHKSGQSLPILGPPLRRNGFPGERVFSLSEFLGSISGIDKGNTFTRREVIKYIANVRGGVHLNAKVRNAEKKLVERIGKIEKRVVFESINGLLVELVAIAQAVAESPDARSLVADIRGRYGMRGTTA